MKRLLALLVLLAIVVVPCAATVSTFQDWSSDGFYCTHVSPGSCEIDLYSDPQGSIGFAETAIIWGSDIIFTTVPTVFTYAGFDVPISDCSQFQPCSVILYDSAYGSIYESTNLYASMPGRVEVKVVGTSPTVYVDGVLVQTGIPMSVLPSYLGFRSSYNGPHRVIDNVIVGEPGDHYIVSALPANWTIQRDMITPVSTGIYGWNPNTNAWVLKNSDYFYIDADKEDLASIENVVIKLYATGATANTTPVTGVHNLIQYDIDYFLSNPPSSIGSYMPDGLYSVGFEGSTHTEQFWVMSSGAVINFDKTLYHAGDTATLTYTITPAYYDTVTYDYTYKIVDIFGVEKTSGAISAASGTFTVDTTDYTQGVIYAEIVATKKADSIVYILGYDTAEIVETLYLNGYVMDAESGAVLNHANVSITQGSQANFSYSIPSGAWNSSAEWVTGAISVNTTLTGYTPDLRAFTPLSSKTISLNISLLSVTPTATGATIGGIVRDDVFGNPVTGATYHVGVNTATTNIAGFARVTALVSGSSYDVYSTKVGYADSTHYTRTAVSV